MRSPDGEPGERPEARPPSWGAMFRWSALLLAGSLLVAAISIPLLRFFGVDA